MIKKEWLAKACLFSCCSGIVGTQNIGVAFNLREVNPVYWFYFLREYITRYLFPDYYTSNLAEEVRKIFKECFGNKNEYARHESRDYLNDFCDEIQEIGVSLGARNFCLEIKRFYFLTIEPTRIEIFFKHSDGKLIRKFRVESKEKLEEVKSFFEFIAEKSRQNIEKIDELKEKCNFYVNVDENNCENFVITWPDNFKPKFTFENKEIENVGELFISKLEYNISTGNFFAYSPGYKEGKSPINLEKEDVETLFKSIKKQKEDFDSNLINKVKKQISEKYTNVGWRYDKEHEGTFEVEGKTFTISLELAVIGEEHLCKVKLFGRHSFDCNDFGEVEEKFDDFMKGLKFAMKEIEKLKNTGNFEEEISGSDVKLVPKKPFLISFVERGDVSKCSCIHFKYNSDSEEWVANLSLDNIRGKKARTRFCLFKLDEEDGRKEFSNFVELLEKSNGATGDQVISYGTFGSDLPAPPQVQ